MEPPLAGQLSLLGLSTCPNMDTVETNAQESSQVLRVLGSHSLSPHRARPEPAPTAHAEQWPGLDRQVPQCLAAGPSKRVYWRVGAACPCQVHIVAFPEVPAVLPDALSAELHKLQCEVFIPSRELK